MKKTNIRWQLVAYDIIILVLADMLLLVLSGSSLPTRDIAAQMVIAFLCIFISRLAGDVYGQIWRYGGIQCYIRLIVTDAIAFLATLLAERVLPVQHIAFSRLLAVACVNLLGSLSMRMFYRYAFKCGNDATPLGRFWLFILKLFAGNKIAGERTVEAAKIKIAIIGAGRVGVSLAEELLNNAGSAYLPCCFVDVNKAKAGRGIHNIPVLMENETTLNQLGMLGIQEVVFAIPNLDDQRKKSLYEHYRQAGYKIKVYDYPAIQTAGGKRHLREFDIEELLFRKPVAVNDARTKAYYHGKVILITGGGGSIGSELCRQLAKMGPKQIIILDIYENGAYDVQQELRTAYAGKLDVRIEIMSITHKQAVESVFRTYRPQIVIHAAAHKHVPLMEHNCIEAVQNNVFGTKNVLELCEEFGVERFMLVSTDKAVNPTNVMGATKRMCEMMVQSASTHSKVKYSATRFGRSANTGSARFPGSFPACSHPA